MEKKIQEQIKQLEIRLDKHEREMRSRLIDVRHYAYKEDVYSNVAYIFASACKLDEETKKAVGCREKISMLKSLISECDEVDTLYPRFKVDDRVRIKKDLEVDREYDGIMFLEDMKKDGVFTILQVECYNDHAFYALNRNPFAYSQEMLEPVEEGD